MDRSNDRAYWSNKAATLLKKQRGILNVNLEKQYASSDTKPAVGGQDGIYIGIIMKDGTPIARDRGTHAELTRSGYNPNVGMLEQLRFKRPAMFKAVSDGLIAIEATGEPVLSFVTETTPLQEAHLIKMAPVAADRVMWTIIDVKKLTATTASHWGPEVAEYLSRVKLML